MALLQTIQLPSRCARLRVLILVRCLLQILHYSCRMPLDTVQADFNRLISPVDASIYFRQLGWFFWVFSRWSHRLSDWLLSVLGPRLLQLLLFQFQSHRKQIYLAIGLMLVVSGNQRLERCSLTRLHGSGTTLPLLVWTSVPLLDTQPQE